MWLKFWQERIRQWFWNPFVSVLYREPMWLKLVTALAIATAIISFSALP